MIPLGEPWFLEALVVGAVTAALAGMVGVAVVVERRVFLAGGIAHAAYGGVGLAWAAGVSPFWGAVVFAGGGAVLLRRLERHLGARADTLIGVLWSLGMAIGVVAIDLTPGYAPDLMGYLFGSMLMADPEVAALLPWFAPAVVAAAVLTRARLSALLFDAEWSALAGAPVRRWQLVLDLVTALTMMMAMRLVGLILVMALLTVPASMALPGARSTGHAMARAAGLAALFVVLGLVGSALLDLRSGAGVVLVTCTAYMLWALVRRRS